MQLTSYIHMSIIRIHQRVWLIDWLQTIISLGSIKWTIYSPNIVLCEAVNVEQR